MGNDSSTIQKFVSYEDVQYIIKNTTKSILINTLPHDEQECLIDNTIPVADEVTYMNELLENEQYENIYVYGKNYMDSCTNKKYEQLLTLGFKNVYIYGGGMFEWLLLQDIYGNELFPTTSRDLDIIKYRPNATHPINNP
jgi:hypothetical protein